MNMSFIFARGTRLCCRAVLCCVFGLISLHARTKATWLKLETPAFTIYSDASQKQVADCAVQYAAFRQALTTLFVQPGQSLPPSLLVLFRDESSFAKYAPGYGNLLFITSNFSIEVDGTPYSTFALGDNSEKALAQTFEFETVWGLKRLGYYVPVWMSQGAGEVLSELKVRKGKCIIGRQEDHTYRNDFAWPKFFELSEDSPAYKNPKQLSGYLSQAWGLMHWILLKDDATRERFTALADRLHNTAGIDAVAAVMATPSGGFDRAIDRHLSAHFRQPREIPFDEAALRATLHFLPAPEAEVLAETSNFLAATGQIAACNDQLDRARALAPDLPAVKEAWARRMLREGSQDDAVSLYREAIAAGTKNFAAYIVSATARLNDSMTGGRDVVGEGGSQADLAAGELQEAIKLNPGSTAAYHQLGRAFFVKTKITDADVAELGKGIVSTEEGAIVRYYHALLNARLNRVDDFRTDLQKLANDPNASAKMRSVATQELGRM